MSGAGKKETPAERTPLCEGCPLRGHEKDIEGLFTLLADITTLNAIEVVTIPYQPAEGADRDKTDEYIYRIDDGAEPSPSMRKMMEQQAYRHQLIKEVREYLREQDAQLEASGTPTLPEMMTVDFKARRKQEAVKAVLARRRKDAAPSE